ncbi:TPA: hypothetical protein ACPZBE_004023 [Morganella morganii]|uniref:hypothetical protein n=1 Tax=Morganella morganii TaxID=582 RepID=UPI0034D5D051
MKRNIAIFAFFLSFCFSSAAVTNGKKITAPLGLKWGMTKSEIAKKEGYIKGTGPRDGVEQFLMKNTDSKIDGLDLYNVGVDEKYGLTNVDMMFFIKNDESGEKSIAQYNALKRVLVSKYGEQYSEEYLWRDNSEGSISLAACIYNERCGKYTSSFWDNDGGNVMLLLLADSYGEHIKIFLLYKSPAIKKIKEEAKASSEREVQKKAQELSDSL